MVGGLEPAEYFRDKIPIQNVGIWPRMGNMVNLEVVYAQRQAQRWGGVTDFSCRTRSPIVTFCIGH